MSKRLAKKVLLIGWDAADWKVINPLLDSGQMPALERLVNGGVMGNIATLDPPLSPMLWTSIATGKTADKHGILGFVEPEPSTMNVRPVSVTSRKVKAIWNILTQQGLKTHVVGWWPSHPAEPINGVCISNMYSNASEPIDKPWPLMPGTVYPKELESTFAEFRVHPGEISPAHILPFVPMAEKVDQEKDKRLHSISKILSSCSSYHAATTWILENKEWDFAAVYLDAIDHFCHSFMKFHPPHREGVPQDLYDIYKDAVSNAYRFHDMMLERLVNLAGPDTTIVLLSDHGFHSNHLRPNKLPKDPVAPALEHSPFGVICVNGPHIRKDERIYGASILDVTPTLLSLFGLPLGKDMDGKPLLQIFEDKVIPDYIESWENEPGECGMHPAEMQEDPWTSQEAMAQLVELGYIEAPGEDKQKRLNQVRNESQFYLAKSFMHSKKHEEALPILEKLFNENPSIIRYAFRLASCYQALRRNPECRKIIESLRENNVKEMPHLDFLEGTLLIRENRPRKALAALKKAEEETTAHPNLHVQVGKAYLMMKKWQDAERAFQNALAIDIDNSEALHGLSISFLRQERYEEAAEEALNAIGLTYHFPQAHYHLGEALYGKGEYQQASEAFGMAAKMTPGNRKAHQWLIKLYEGPLQQPDKAGNHREFIAEKIKGTITVVTGLPRSGTSMMMQMLKEGGLEIFTDQVRQGDKNNPNGYLEYEKVKSLHLDNSWLHEAEGKCIKVVAPLLPYLPGNFNYQIIFMKREMEEVLRSQQIMLGKLNEVKKNAFPMALAQAFGKQVERAETWIRSQPNVSVLYVNYTDVILNAREQGENIYSFLANDLDIDRMTAAVDEKLYRNRTTAQH